MTALGQLVDGGRHGRGAGGGVATTVSRPAVFDAVIIGLGLLLGHSGYTGELLVPSPRSEKAMANEREPARRERTHDPGATPVGARRGYVRTITAAMIVLVALVVVWWIVAQILFL